MNIPEPVVEIFNNQEIEVWPRIVWHPNWGMTFAEIRSKVSDRCSITHKSTMIIKGRNIILNDLTLDGSFTIRSEDDVQVYLFSFQLLFLIYKGIRIIAYIYIIVLYSEQRMGGSSTC